MKPGLLQFFPSQLFLLLILPLPSISGGCSNDRRFAEMCSTWSHFCSSASWGPWMDVYCPETCTACSSCQCQDHPAYISKCDGWKSHCSRGRWKDFVNARCPATCNACQCCEERTNLSGDENCAAWESTGYCSSSQYGAWMWVNCYKSCSSQQCDERNPDPEGGENGGETTTTTITTITTTTPPPTTTTTVTTTTTTTTASTSASASSCAKCGLKTQGRRVVGGEDSQVNEYPWMVGLYTQHSTLPSCGGSLINSKWVITAGHCHTSSHPLTKAVLGEHDTRVTTETQIRIERGITRKIRHPEYNDDTLKNDIALFCLDQPVDTDVYVPVCMPAPGSDYEGLDAWVTGWGTTTEDGVQAEILQELELTVVNDGTCYEAMTAKLGTYWGKTFANEQICAGGEAGKDGCQGDSGGPFVHDRGEDVWELIGVVSWGLGCARPGVYGIYTEVDHYLSWIATTLTTEEGRSVPVESIGCV